MSQPRHKSLKQVLAGVVTALLVATGSFIGIAAPASAAPAATVTPTVAAASTDGLTINVAASGLTGAIYAGLYEKSDPASLPGTFDYASFALPFPAVSDGNANFNLVAAASELDRTKAYEVILWDAHEALESATLQGRAGVTVTTSEWDIVFPSASGGDEGTGEESGSDGGGETGSGEDNGSGEEGGSGDDSGDSGEEGDSDEPEAAPVLTVSKPTGLDAAGETVTVTGTGYNPEQAIYVFLCGDIELPANLWTHALGCQDGASVVYPPGSNDREGNPRANQFEEDGSFSLSFDVKQLDEGATSVFTAANHSGMNDRTQDAKATLEFGDEVQAAPVLSVSKSTGLDAAGETVTVTGTGYNPAQPIYVFLCGDIELPANLWTHALGCQSGASVVYPPGSVDRDNNPRANQFDEDGSFSLSFDVRQLDEGATSVFTAANHSGMNDRTQDAKATLEFTEGNGGDDEGEGDSDEAGTPQIVVSPNAPINPVVDNVLTVTGANFTGAGAANGAYVLFGQTSIWSGAGPLVSEGWDVQGWVMPHQITDGAFTYEVVIPANTLDPTKSYQIATSAAHGLAFTDRSLDTFTEVEIQVPELAIVGNPIQGESVEFIGSGFQPGELVTGTVYSTPTPLGTANADADGIARFSWTIPADFATGEHTVELVAESNTVRGTFEVTAPAKALVPAPAPAQTEATCTARSVTGGSLNWGLKSSFSSYVRGPIANGSYSGGSFAAAGGAINAADGGIGRANFSGAITVSGHGGLLNFNLSNPSIQITGPGTGVLFAHVSSTKTDGSPAMNGTVAFANLSFSGPVISGDTLSVTGASATLTGAGATGFGGFYDAGTALDPVSFSVTLGGDVACDETTDPVLAATGADSMSAGLGFAVLALMLGAGLLFSARRRGALAQR